MSLPPGHIARRLRIRGRVQGVSYRWWTVRTARELGLDGWVRNRHDGSVEALAAGPAQAVEALIERCRQGPPAARVDDIEVVEALGIVAEGFTQKPTV
jgi:acylphosphatase